MAEGILTRSWKLLAGSAGMKQYDKYTDPNAGSTGAPALTPAGAIVFSDQFKIALQSDTSISDEGKAAVFRTTGTTKAELLDLYARGQIGTAALLFAGIPIPAKKGKTELEIALLNPTLAEVSSQNTAGLSVTAGQTFSINVPNGNRVRWSVLSPESVNAETPKDPNCEKLDVSLTGHSVTTEADSSTIHTFTANWLRFVKPSTGYGAQTSGDFKALVRFELYAG